MMYLFNRGESYAGIYVPTLVHKIMEENRMQRTADQINLKGFAVSTVSDFIKFTYYDGSYTLIRW